MRFNIMSQGQPGANNGSFLPNICERNDMSLEGKCCWEKGNSGLRIADMFYLSETFPPPPGELRPQAPPNFLLPLPLQ